MRDLFRKDRGIEIPRGSDAAGIDALGTAAAPGQEGARYPLQGRHVCPFCGSVNETMEGPCPQCTMGNTAETRKATKSRIGPWYVLQSRNPAAPGMKYQTLLGFVRKGRVKARSIVRGPTTHQLWRFACQVKGLSREFGVCYSCGGAVDRDAQLCPQCNRLQDPPADPDVFVEGQAGGATPDAPQGHPQGFGAAPAAPREVQQDLRQSPIFRELTLPPAFDIPAAAPSRGEAPAVPSAARAAARAPGVFDDVQAPETPSPAPSPAAALPPAAPATAPQRPAPATTTSAGGVPPAAPPPASPARRNANDVFLSAKDLAAAFQLGFDGDGDDEDDANGTPPSARRGAGATSQAFDPEAPWANDAPAAAWPPRSPPRRRRKRRLGRMLLLIVLLAAVAFGGYLAVDGVFRRRVFDWAEGKYMALTGANLYPDLGASRNTTGSGTTAPPGAAPDRAEADADTDAVPAAVPAAVAPRSQPPASSPPAPSGSFTDRTGMTGARPGGGDTTAATTVPAAPKPPPAPRETTRAQADPVVATPARTDVRVSPGTQPVRTPPVRTPPQQAETKPDNPPAPTREQNLRKSAELWKRALKAEQDEDYRTAKATYEEIMSTLPKDVWYQGVETRLRVAKEMLGEK